MQAAVFIAVLIATVWVLAMRRAPLAHWAGAALVLGLLSRIDLTTGVAVSTDWPGWVLALLPSMLLGLLTLNPLRLALVTTPAYRLVRRMLPKVSRTEQEALDAGTVGWDAELFGGQPDYRKLFDVPRPALSPDEQAFLDGPVETVCAMIDDWHIRHTRADLPPDVWQHLKQHGFLGMLIAKKYGGLGFSAQAQSQVVSKIASRSIAAGITVMVPNSLGPGELLEKYGTEAQKEKYLNRLAKGLEIPCFALTGPHAGSDAAGMRDVGTVCYGLHEGRQVLGVRLSWDKRYITLAPVATLVGLAFNLHDPDHLLGEREEIGITLALIPADFSGVRIGRRHFPARSAFMNGPIQGKDVFVPMEFLIGGIEYAGQGWRMLMECLATGRAISLPAIGSVSIKHALRVSSAYARIRRQFGIPVGLMEGVADPLSRLVRSAYVFEAARGLTAAMVDAGQRPAVISALLKYRTTEAMRDRVNDAMDIHGGRAVQDGPSNYLFSGYATTPVAITVEGANILTRSLITFAQGALRAHPYLYAEIAAVQSTDRQSGLAAFDKAFAGHVSFMLRNMAGSLWHGLTGAAFAATPVRHEMARWYRQLSRYAQSFALVGDWTVVFLGGDLKRKQLLSGRMADILSELYLLSTALRRYEDDGRIAQDKGLLDAVARDALHRIERSFDEVFANFPNRWLAAAMRVLVFPLGRHARPASDRETFRLARAAMSPGAFRDRLTRGTYVSMSPRDVTGVLEDALLKVTAAEEIEAKFIRAIKKGVVVRRLDRDAIADAVATGVLTEAEATVLRLADEATDRAIKVDDFDPDELATRQVPRGDDLGRAAE